MGEPIHLLGIHDGHNCGATLTRNGVVVASVSEERLTRRKNEVGYPARAVEEVLRLGGVSARELDEVVYASLFMHGKSYLTDLEPWYRVGLAEQRAARSQPKEYQKIVFERRRQERVKEVCDHLEIDAGRVAFLDHHLCHVAAAYYTSPYAHEGKPVLGLTCDGSGDNLAGSVSVCRDGRIERLASISRHASIGKVYSRVTMLMGMTPWEHEYKIMGLAPYADRERADRAAEPLRGLLRISDDGLRIEQAGELSMNYCYQYLREVFEAKRFDVIAGAVQLFTEEMLTKWIASCIRETGIADIVCGGGVFMNVKANMLIAQLPEVASMYVMPSAGDESLSIGACLWRYHERRGAPDGAERPLDSLYLGGGFGRAEERAAIEAELKGCDVEILETPDVDTLTADYLADGKTVARCRGRMEWGARALGNRSILSSAHDRQVVTRINDAIKQRDFWMPFAPSIREESAGRYIDDPKDLRPYYMTHAFPAKRQGYADLTAASHPRDRTIRPQVVTREANPDYHRLITRFEERTGRGVVLNTSFNLHGFPIVNSPADAIRVMKRSDLEYLALGHFMIRKRVPSG